jgi:hypothetical protein
MTAFIRIVDVDVAEKPVALLQSVRNGDSVYWRNPQTFKKIPGNAFVYWLPDSMVELFKFNSQWKGIETRCGLGTLDDFRFLRLWFEVESSVARWVPFAKGGSFSPFYPEIDLRLNWEDEGRELKIFVEQKVGSATRKVQGQEFYFRNGVTWPRLPHVIGSFQILPNGCIFSDGGPAMFARTDEELLAITAILNSATFLYLLESLMARGTEGGQTLKYEAGYVISAPLPPEIPVLATRLLEVTKAGWLNGATVAARSETSVHFYAPNGGKWESTTTLHLREILAKADDIAEEAFGLAPEDALIVRRWAEVRRGRLLGNHTSGTNSSATAAAEVDPFLSWAVGVSFGRFDIRMVTEQSEIQFVPQPFDPLPVKSPGMPPNEKPQFDDHLGILIDDPGQSNDLPTLVSTVYERANKPAPEQQLLRRVLAHEFFAAHIKMYSKSRRKAPIYWQLATPTGSYSVWLYIHRFSKDTLFRVQNDYVAPKLAHERRQLDALRGEGGQSPTESQRKAIEAREVFVEELQAFYDEVTRVAPLWNPALDDGVIINFAPLWRLVPQNKAWQKELRSCWQALVTGDYDWSHLSMHFWPERVLQKCATDRSLAIAHGLEDVFWFEDDGSKWKPRDEPKQSIANLVLERSSPAVKAALKVLIEAPDTISGTKRGRKAKTV